MPSHCRMRAFDRDLIRGGHYGQRSCEPQLKAEHMAAPTNAAYVKKVLANSEPSTHGTRSELRSACRAKSRIRSACSGPPRGCPRLIPDATEEYTAIHAPAEVCELG